MEALIQSENNDRNKNFRFQNNFGGYQNSALFASTLFWDYQSLRQICVELNNYIK